MQSKLQEITEKIYQEGVSRGNEEAEKIIAGARTEAAFGFGAHLQAYRHGCGQRRVYDSQWRV